MYLLYLDESGNENGPADRYFVLGGIALFERQIYFLNKAVEEIQEKHFPNHPPIPFHASEIRSGRDLWRKVPVETREQVLRDLCDAVIRLPNRGRLLFATAIEKSREFWGEKAVEKATEEICRRFDMFLRHRYQSHGDPQRGLLIFSEGRFDERAKLWVREFHQRGTSWGTINNLADIPYFASMRESRLLQIADLVSHATWLLYERRDARFVRALLPCFDAREGKIHGLVHVRADITQACACPACFSRRVRAGAGPWLAETAPAKVTTIESPSTAPTND